MRLAGQAPTEALISQIMTELDRISRMFMLAILFNGQNQTIREKFYKQVNE